MKEKNSRFTEGSVNRSQIHEKAKSRTISGSQLAISESATMFKAKILNNTLMTRNQFILATAPKAVQQSSFLNNDKN